MAKKKLLNLTIIDRQPEVTNFVYRGVPEDSRQKIIENFSDKNCAVIQFEHDEGFTVTAKEVIHSLVFTAYMSFEEEEELQRPDPEA